MKCPHCQHENPEDARFCNGCGHKLELACPGCGKVNPPGSNFCKGMKDELKSYLLNLQGLEFIYEKQLFPELEYIFKHALTQEVAND